MPDERLDPYEALASIRLLAQIAYDADEPNMLEKTLREILNVCDKVLPKKLQTRRKPRPN